MTTTAEGSYSSTKRTFGKTVALLCESAVAAFVQAFVVLLLGRIALSLVGGIWWKMIPSLPPGFSHSAAADAQLSTFWNTWLSQISEHRFAIVFFLLFALTARARLSNWPGEKMASSGGGLDKRIGRRLSNDWFGLLVGNAFGALFTAMALVWVQQFSLTHWLFGWLLKPLVAQLATAAAYVFGEAFVDGIQALCAWYGANLFKFNFWLLYLGFICDDLGLPNLKTLGRFIWYRIGQRREVCDFGCGERSKLKPEVRNPKSERTPKTEIRN